MRVYYTGSLLHAPEVGVVRPRPFVEDADWYLVIATAVDVSLHSLLATNASTFWPPQPSQYVIGNDDVQMHVRAGEAREEPAGRRVIWCCPDAPRPR